MAELRLQSPLQYVKGVGPRKAAVLAQHGMQTVNDLLWYFPRSYLDRSTIVPINQIRTDQMVTIVGQVKAHGILYGRRKRYEVILEDSTGAISLIWFQPLHYWSRVFKKGQWYAASGIVSYFMGHQIVHPDLERLDDESDKMIHAGRIIPVYPQTSALNKVGLNSKGIRRLTTYIFEHLSETIPDHLPAEEIRIHKLPALHEAIYKIHYPDSREQIETCRRRLAFDELLELQFLVFKSRQERKTITKQHKYWLSISAVEPIVSKLPFTITSSQQQAIQEIIHDLQQPQPMSRMLQGDVGCGKTLVAIAAAFYAAKNSFQTAFMAPTEILAEQHYRNWHNRLTDEGVTSALLTSSLSKVKKEQVAMACAEGKIDILFGTHALIYDYVSLPRLGFVIIDEQHRFGVKQRGKLYEKGENPDLLVMTATPIPRTLTLTLYGDLDITTINELPPGRKPVRTAWRTQEVRKKVYAFVRDEIAKGGQAYIIYPIIEKSERIDLENVEDAFRELSVSEFKDFRVGMVHGRIKSKERDDILKQFHDGELDILIATTVVEVGLDNPNATVMIIEHAERFGLAQLHQLRGRIGRGSKQATLIAIAHPPLTDIAKKRLEYFTQTTDGFKIAEADLELRGPGEIYGVKQSGLPELRAARLSVDKDLLEAARQLLSRLFGDTRNLDSRYRNLYTYLEEKTASRSVSLGGG